MAKKEKDSPLVNPTSDPYAHRKHRAKYQVGYGAEGVARGKTSGDLSSKGLSPREQSEAKEDKDNKQQKLQYSKTRPNPY
jgi:hypothetical protein